MKAILEFNLPEEECDFRIASKAMEWALAALELDQYLREGVKYGNLDEGEREIYTRVRDEFRDILDARCIGLDEIQ